MGFSSSVGIAFSEIYIAVRAPQASGVYGIFNRDTWLYIGESGNIQERLYQHVRGETEQSERFLAYRPTGFIFEECAASGRLAREAELVAELNPVCNL